MKHAHVAAFVLGGAVLGTGGYLLGRQSTAHGDPASPAEAATAASERKALYWHDPMVPGPRFDKPGKSPFMDMQLVPVYADDQGGSGVKVSPDVQQNLGIRTAVVARTDSGVVMFVTAAELETCEGNPEALAALLTSRLTAHES